MLLLLELLIFLDCRGWKKSWKPSGRWVLLKDVTFSLGWHIAITTALQLHSNWLKQKRNWGVFCLMLLNSSYISSWSHTTTYKFLQLDMNITMLKSREKKIAMEEESFSHLYNIQYRKHIILSKKIHVSQKWSIIGTITLSHKSLVACGLRTLQ